jgi:glycerol uptake facilitator-like aquaporin
LLKFEKVNIKELLVEFIISFQLFFFGTAAFVFSEHHPEFGPLAVGLVFGISVYIGIMLFTKISIGHISPSVTTMGMLLTEVKPKNGILLILVQLIASVCATLLLSTIVNDPDSLLGLNVPHTGLW